MAQTAKSAAYWQKRSEYLQAQLLKKGEDFSRETAKKFDVAIGNIEKEISAFYGRFAKNNQISFAEAQRILTTAERDRYRMDVQSYIEKGRTLNYTNKWAHQLENASTVHRVTRLQALQTQMRQQFETAYSAYNAGMTDTAKAIFTEGYHHNIYDVQQGYGYGSAFSQLDTAKVEKVIAKPWTADGQTFSDKIWHDKDKLLHTLDAKLAQAFIRGDDLAKVAKELVKTCDVSKSNALRLVQTESAYFASAARQESYQALGVTRCQVLATLDLRTSELCQDMDGKIVEMAQYEPGVTVPPFHPWCRSTTIPYFEDETGPRTARDKDGRSYEVPGDMTYRQWYDKYVTNGKTVATDNKRTGKDTREPTPTPDANINDLPESTASALARSSGQVGDTDGNTVIQAVEVFDYSDAEAVQRELTRFCDDYAYAEIEHAVVIAPNNRLYRLSGTTINVNAELVGLDTMSDAIVIHNHPISPWADRDDSFSRYDIMSAVKGRTRKEYLVSGKRRNAFTYTGDKTASEMSKEYKKAVDQVRDDAFKGKYQITWLQEAVLRHLAREVEGFLFYEDI